MSKIYTLNQLPALLKQVKLAQIVLVGGCFDILHLGHVRFLKAAKAYGTVLVLLESDESLQKYKGLKRPIHKQQERAEVLAALDTVDFVILLPPLTSDQAYSEITQQIKPAVIALTEGDPKLLNKQKQAAAVGGKVVVIPKIKTPSTTQLARLLRLEQ